MNWFVRILFVFMVCIFWTGSSAWGGLKFEIDDQSGVENHGVSQAKEYDRQDPLIDILIRKGILTEEEAKKIQKEAVVLEEQRRQEVQEAAKEITCTLAIYASPPIATSLIHFTKRLDCLKHSWAKTMQAKWPH